MKTLIFTTFAMTAFAANSVLGRLALKGELIDAGSFSAIRLFSGAMMLLLLVILNKTMNKNSGSIRWREGSWITSLYLFVYALAFSYAYLSLDTGSGALVLFAAVQVTMVIMSLIKGKMLSRYEWLGLIIAFSGLSYLLLPSATAPPLLPALLMLVSGIAWGLYTLAGKGAADPLLQSCNNFLRTIPFIAVLLLFTLEQSTITTNGVLLAIASGAITSGLGYAIWYVALKGLTVTQAAVVQLSVPIIAAFGGVFFVNEAISTALVISALLVLGGILVSSIVKR
ncbi:membrane protein [Psychromonas marina]|uniref:Membrane protein n=1 Tax=Psychromonas marina TaxID=88364 RepID=A0ABQ6E113_9GAMM|nr:DMT family transporter [Psychromonas marina]GLS91032.1 membrane protein [Psychromonas marina]